MTSGVTLLLAPVVRAREIALATPVDALLDPGFRRVLGFELIGRDGVRCFLPWAACDVVAKDGAQVEVAPSALEALRSELPPAREWSSARSS